MNDLHIFDADLDALAGTMDWVRGHIEKAGFSDRDATKIELALEEAIVNIIHYGYEEKKGQIELKCHLHPDCIEFILKDQGIAFNPLAKIQNVEDLEKKVGGLGILLIKNYMDSVHYERDKAYNVLILKKDRR